MNANTSDLDIDHARQAVHELVLSIMGLTGTNADATTSFISHPSRNQPDSKGNYPGNAYGLSVVMLDKILEDNGQYEFDDKIRAVEMLTAMLSRATTLPHYLDPRQHVGDTSVVDAVSSLFERCLSAQSAITTHWNNKVSVAPTRRPKV